MKEIRQDEPLKESKISFPENSVKNFDIEKISMPVTDDLNPQEYRED